MFRKLWIILLMSIAATGALAQTATDASITGTVTDSEQAAIQGAIVRVTDIATGVVSTASTNNRGQYHTPPLKIGTYTVAIESSGFKQYKEANVVLDIGSVRQIDAALTPGEVVDTVNVQAGEAELLQRSDSSVGTVITTQQIEELPLNGGSTGRDYLQLATLSAGTSSSSQGVSIGGQSGAQAAFLLDGIDNNNQEILTSHSGQKEVIKPSVDAISEFKVVTTSYSSEYGRSSSGVVSVNLKSGTNVLHGSAFEFLRNDAVDAIPYFSKANLPFKYNDFGGTLGGPIRKDRTFVFGDVEFFRLRQQNTIYTVVPTDAQKSGQFSSAIYDPTAGFTVSGTTITRTTAFAGNQIPTARIDPIAQNLLKYYPEPNFIGTGSLAKNNYTCSPTSNANNYRWDIRVDEAVNGKQNLFGRFSSEQTRNPASSTLPPLNGQYYAGSGGQANNAQALVIGYNVVVSPTVLASVRVGWNKIYWSQAFPKQSLTGVGIPGVATNAPGFSQITVSNYATIGTSNVPNSDNSQNREIAADLTWTRGPHTLKWGWQEYWLQTNFNSSQLTSGIFAFNGQYTNKNAKSSGATVDQDFADFLLGLSSKEQLSSPSILNFRSPYSHFFLQDDWKASRTLTVNLGLRYELSPPAVSKFNTIANFDEDSNPGSPQLIYAGQFGNSRSQRALQNVNYTNFAPRIGFAFSPENSKTVLRGGYGIFYSNAITIGGMQSMENNPPVNQLRLVTSPSPTVTSQFAYLQNGFATGALSLSNANGASGVSLVSFDRHAAIPIDQQWDLNVQRALPFGIVGEVGYYGNKFDHNWWQVDGNPAPATPTSALPSGGINGNRLYKSTTIPIASKPIINLGTVSRVWKEGWSQYNGLQVKAEKRYAKGLTFIASYSYSKVLGVGDTQQFQNPANIQAEKAVMNTDQRNHFVGSAVYSLPFGHGRKFGGGWNRWADGALGGWTVSPILTLASGTPLNLTEAANPSNSGGTADRPNLGGDLRAATDPVTSRSTHSLVEWFNTSAIQAQASGTYGNAPRNAIVSPHTVLLDAAIHKTLTFNEHLKAQLRLESFNVTNTPHFGSPGLDVGSPTSFGIISTTTGNPRQNQIALKLLF